MAAVEQKIFVLFIYSLIYLTRKLQEGLVATGSAGQCDGSVNQQEGLLVGGEGAVRLPWIRKRWTEQGDEEKEWVAC